MKRFTHLLFALLISLFLHQFAYAISVTPANTNKSKPIIGFAPYMHSIGAAIDKTTHVLYDQSGKAVLTPNSIIYIPTLYCDPTIQPKIPSLFQFADQDNDLCATESQHGLLWYTLTLPDNKQWNDVSNWEDLIDENINAVNAPGSLIPPRTIPESAHTYALKIPDFAVGKRIGFRYTPTAKSGVPNTGTPIKVWDITHAFGQLPFSNTGQADSANSGQKLDNTEIFSDIGVVVNALNAPRIDNLFMAGTFALNSSLEARYTFIANNQSVYEEESRFWWGKADTTLDNATFDNPSYSLSKSSPVLTENDIATIYEVTVLPVKKENNYFVVGSPTTVKSDNPNNQFTQAPSIESLKITPPLTINSTLQATYRFNNGGVSNSIDSSRYTWKRQINTNQWETLESNTVTTSGLVPSNIMLDIAKSGMLIEVSVEPRDQLGGFGKVETNSARVEGLEQLEADKESLIFSIADTKTVQLNINAVFSTGTIIDVTSEGIWTSNDPDILVNEDGLVSVSTKNQTAKASSITFKLLNKQLEIPVQINASDLKVSDIHFTSAAQDEIQIVGQTATVSYRFDNGGDQNIQDNSIARFYIVDSRGTQSNLAQSSNSKPGNFESVVIDARYEGQTLFVEITPRDQYSNEGKPETHSVLLSKLVSLEIVHPNIYVSVPTQLQAIARFNNGTVMNVTEQGDWTSPDEPFLEFSTGNQPGIVTPHYSILKGIVPPEKTSAMIEFDFGTNVHRIAYVEKRVDILTTNMTTLWGTHTNNALELTTSLQTSNIFRPWGADYLTSFKDEDGSLLIGSQGGTECGQYVMCDLDLQRINEITAFDGRINNSGQLTSFAWQYQSGVVNGFQGKIAHLDQQLSHSNLATGDIIGVILYADGPINSSNNKISGIRFVYKLKNP